MRLTLPVFLHLAGALSLAGQSAPGGRPLLLDSTAVMLYYPPVLAQAGVGGRMLLSVRVSDSGRFVPGSLTILSSSQAQFEASLHRSLGAWRFLDSATGAPSGGSWQGHLEIQPPSDWWVPDTPRVVFVRRSRDSLGVERILLGSDPVIDTIPLPTDEIVRYQRLVLQWGIRRVTADSMKPAQIVCAGYLVGKRRESVSGPELVALATAGVAVTSLERCPPTFTSMVSRPQPAGTDPYTALVGRPSVLRRRTGSQVIMRLNIGQGTGRHEYECRIPYAAKPGAVACRATRFIIS